jgi:SAM-dependent methyltransferase
VTDVSVAYEGSAAAWEAGPARLYDRLAERIIASAGGELEGMLVLDVGAGTGALCRAVRARNGTPVALDPSADMLAHAGDAALISVTGDMLALPFIDNSFDAAVSAFAVSHVEAPVRALAEMGRVVRGGARVVVGVFGATPPNPSKDVVDDVAARFGYLPPAWYARLKAYLEPLSNTPELLSACAHAGGLHDVRIEDVVVDSGLNSAEAIVGYRLGMAHLAPFVRSLSSQRREDLLAQAVSEVRERGQAVRPRVLILSCRAAA